jgi:DNA-binding NarL/FixJ family response regulator
MVSVLTSTNEPIVEVGLRALFDADSDFSLLHVCGTHSETAAWAKSHQPDLILYGLTLDTDLTAIEELRWIARESSIVFWCREIPPALAHQLVGLGVKGFLDTKAPLETVRDCLRMTSAGQIWMENTLSMSLLNLRPIKLSPRQRQLIGLLVRGLKNKEIALTLGISEATVKAYLTTLFEKVGAKDRFELALFGLKNFRDLAGSSTGRDSQMPAPIRPKGEVRSLGWRTVA